MAPNTQTDSIQTWWEIGSWLWSEGSSMDEEMDWNEGLATESKNHERKRVTAQSVCVIHPLTVEGVRLSVSLDFTLFVCVFISKCLDYQNALRLVIRTWWFNHVLLSAKSSQKSWAQTAGSGLELKPDSYILILIKGPENNSLNMSDEQTFLIVMSCQQSDGASGHLQLKPGRFNRVEKRA